MVNKSLVYGMIDIILTYFTVTAKMVYFIHSKMPIYN